jgi:hypothetical protein
MDFPESVPKSVRWVLKRELSAIEHEKELCLQRLARSREVGAQRRVRIEMIALEGLHRRRAAVKRIGTDSRMTIVFDHFAQVKNVLNASVDFFIEDVVSACRDYDSEQSLVQYREELFSEALELSTRLKDLLVEINIDQAVDGMLEGTEALQTILHQTAHFRDKAREDAIQVNAAKASRKTSAKWETLRGVIFAMIARGHCVPQWTDGFFAMVAAAVSVATGEDVSTDDARKAYKVAQKILEEDNA